MKPTNTVLLLVEDNPAEAELMIEALEGCSSFKEVHIARDGCEAIAFLKRQSPFESAPQPDLILLDLNLPRKHGLEVLEEVKCDDSLKHIVVIVVTTSTADADVMKSYQLHANWYLKKPSDWEEFTRMITMLSEFWSGVVVPPRNSGACGRDV